MRELISILLTRPVLAVLSWVRRNPGKFAVSVLALLFLQLNLPAAVLWCLAKLAAFAERLGVKLSSKIKETVSKAYVYVFSDPARKWWLSLVLWPVFPVFAFWLLAWLVRDAARPKTQLSIAK
jgi:hypothetical protein